MIYFDNAASTKPCKESLEAFSDCALNNHANPSALHKRGIEAEKVITAAKETILARLPKGGSLLFTSGGTESNNLAMFGIKAGKKKKIITTAIEHPSVAEPADELERRGFTVVRLPPVRGVEYEEQIIDAVDEDTYLVSVMSVNNETGFIIDTAGIYKQVKLKYPDCTVHVDAVQGFLKTPLGGDLITVSAHKIHAVKGIGGLYVRDGVRLQPQMRGGGQQGGIRPGTEPTELIAAFAAGVGAYNYNHEHFTKLSGRLQELFDQSGGLLNRGRIKINSRNNLPNIMNITVCGIKSEILLHYLAQNDIYVSSGSACAKAKKSKSLLAFGVSDLDADSALRLSFSHDNTIEETETFVAILQKGIDRFK